MPCIDIGGHALGYRLVGKGTKLVTLLHGLAGTKDDWEPVVSHLVETYRVLALDMRGHGESDTPEGEWTRRDLAKDVVDALDALGLDRTILVGHSAGGVIALEVSLRSPEYVAGLVLVSTASEANQRAAEFWEGLAQKAEARGSESVFGDLGVATGARAPDPIGFARASRVVAGLHRHPLTAELPALRVPTTILVGEKDFIGAGGSVIMSRKIPSAKLLIREGASHFVHREEPWLVADLVAAL